MPNIVNKRSHRVRRGKKSSVVITIHNKNIFSALIRILYSQHFDSFVFSTLFIINQPICLHGQVFYAAPDKQYCYVPLPNTN